MQEDRHFSAYYGDYCYLPLYIVAGDIVLWAQLRTSDCDGAEGGSRAAKNRRGDPPALPKGAHHCARGQRLLPE